MSYKIENGKVYEVKEVDATEILKEAKQAVSFIKQHQEAAKPYEVAIANKKIALAEYTEKANKEIAQYQAVVDDHNKKIDEVKAKLEDKKDVIAQLDPETKSFLGY